MTDDAADRVVLDVGIHRDIPAPVYHADPCPAPSLSASIASRICLASPFHAFYDHPRLNPNATRTDAEEFDIGTAAHALLLEGVSSNVAVVDAPDWRTKDARAARDAAYAAGRIPILARRWADVQNMAATARGQLDAQTDGGAAMFQAGDAELTIVWTEPGGVYCRARLDYVRPSIAYTPDLVDVAATRRPAIAIDDYKTTSASANPDQWSRALFGFGADIQAAFYLRGIRALTGVQDVTFRFAVQETFPPYALAVVALGPDALILAEKKILYALDIWRRALTSNDWTGYPRRTCYVAVPEYVEYAWLAKEVRDL